MDYEDSCQVPFDKRQLMAYMEELEESNLFLIGIIEEDEQQFKKVLLNKVDDQQTLQAQLRQADEELREK